MKVAANGFALALLTLIITWGLSGCSKQEAATTQPLDNRNKEAENAGDHSKVGDSKTVGHNGEEHGKHKLHTEGQTRVDHKDHKHGEHHGKQTAPKGGVQVGDKVPDFSVQTLDGKSVKLSELQKETKEGVVVLSFWCATCHSCRDVEHLLAKLAKDQGGNVTVMALDANADDTAESAAAFIKKKALALPVVLDPSGATADLFGVKRTTTTVVIDDKSVLRYCGQFQQKNGGSAEAALKAVLAGKEVAIKTTPHNG